MSYCKLLARWQPCPHVVCVHRRLCALPSGANNRSASFAQAGVGRRAKSGVNRQAYCGNVALKINVKLGGTNWALMGGSRKAKGLENAVHRAPDRLSLELLRKSVQMA